MVSSATSLSPSVPVCEGEREREVGREREGGRDRGRKKGGGRECEGERRGGREEGEGGRRGREGERKVMGGENGGGKEGTSKKVWEGKLDNYDNTVPFIQYFRNVTMVQLQYCMD